MAEIKGQSVQVPFRQAIVDKLGMLTADWESFFRALHLRVGPVSPETSFQLKNNQSEPLPIDGLKFDKRKVTKVKIHYLIQRVTDFTDVIESGELHLLYKPSADEWVLWEPYEPGPSDSGVTWSVDSDGQVKYVSSDISGPFKSQKLTYFTHSTGARVAIADNSAPPIPP